MKTIIFKSLLCATVAASLAACHRNETEPVSQTMHVSIHRDMKASDLAEAGEQLMTPYTWSLADGVFAMTLEKDPDNKKAQLYRAFLKPMMLLRGIGNRAKPMVRAHGDLARYEESIRLIPASPLKDFLLDGPEDLKSAKDVQDLLVEQREAFNDLRVFLKLNSDLEVTLRFNPYAWEQKISEDMKKKCKFVERGPQDFTVDCNWSEITETKLGPADLIAISQMAAGYVLLYDMSTSYSWEGIEAVLPKLQNPRMSGQEKQKVWESVPTLGKLRPDQKLGRALDLGSDFSAAVRWVLKHQEIHCPHGLNDENNRPGYAIQKGLCISNPDEVNRLLAVMDQVLAGAFEVTRKDNKGTQQQTVIDVPQFFRHPALDLRSLAPASYCPSTGSAQTLRDSTFNGLFPRGDASLFVLENCGS